MRFTFLFATCAAALVSADAHAYVHIVQRGETLASIAKRAYGDAKHETILAAVNGLDAQGGASIVPGLRLEVPAPSHHRCSGAETWGALAERFFGDAARGEILAIYNGGMAWIPPPPGQVIAIPFVLTHVASEGETTPLVARRYYGADQRSWEVERFNQLKTIHLARGQVVLVPLFHLTLTDEGRAEASQGEVTSRSEGQGAQRDAQSRAEKDIPLVLGDVRAGRYVDAIARANRLLGAGELTRPQLARVHRALVDAYVAVDATGAAAAACSAWRANEAGSKALDPVRVSPKVRAACDGK